MKLVKNFNPGGKKVLVRCDFNVPVSQNRAILDDFKICQTLPTIRYLLKKKAKVILMSHLDDPAGRKVEKLRLDKVKKKLEKHLKTKVIQTSDCLGKEVERVLKNMKGGEVVLLENLRFHPEEEKGDLGFAKKLAGLADVFVNDAFAASHRKHASLMAAKFLPCFGGILLEREIKALKKIRDNPKEPLVIILGGKAKGMETKLRLIKKMLAKAEAVLLGNLVANELSRPSAASPSGVSRPSAASSSGVRRGRPGLLRSEKVLAPVDSVEDLDIGPKTLELFRRKIAKAKTVFWSGPVGKIEEKRFSNGSREIAEAVIKSRAFSVVGGGETNLFLRKNKLINKFNHVSTGGDAMLAFLAGEKLPGIELLTRH